MIHRGHISQSGAGGDRSHLCLTPPTSFVNILVHVDAIALGLQPLDLVRIRKGVDNKLSAGLFASVACDVEFVLADEVRHRIVVFAGDGYAVARHGGFLSEKIADGISAILRVALSFYAT